MGAVRPATLWWLAAALPACQASWEADLLVHDGEIVQGPGVCARSIHGDVILTGEGEVPRILKCVQQIDGALRVDGASLRSLALGRLQEVLRISIASPTLEEVDLPELVTAPQVAVDWAPRLTAVNLTSLADNHDLLIAAPVRDLQLDSLEQVGSATLIGMDLPGLADALPRLAYADRLRIDTWGSPLSGEGLATEVHVGDLAVVAPLDANLTGIGCPTTDSYSLVGSPISELPSCVDPSENLNLGSMPALEQVTYSGVSLSVSDARALTRVDYSGPTLALWQVGLEELVIDQDGPLELYVQDVPLETLRVRAESGYMSLWMVDTGHIETNIPLNLGQGTAPSLTIDSDEWVRIAETDASSATIRTTNLTLSYAPNLSTLTLDLPDNGRVSVSSSGLTSIPTLPANLEALWLDNLPLRSLDGLQGVSIEGSLVLKELHELVDVSALLELEHVGGDLWLRGADRVNTATLEAMRPRLEEIVVGEVRLEP